MSVHISTSYYYYITLNNLRLYRYGRPLYGNIRIYNLSDIFRYIRYVYCSVNYCSGARAPA